MNRTKPIRKRKKILKRIIIIILIIFTINFIIKGINNTYRILLKYAESEVIKILSIVVNESVNQSAINKLKINNIYTLTKNDKNEIEMIDYNTALVNEFLNEITKKMQDDLINIENKKYRIIVKNEKPEAIEYSIPLGVIFNNPLLNNMGPGIPVKMNFIGSVLTNIKTNVKEYGINNSLIELFINIEIRGKIILPIISKEIVIQNDIPYSYKIINGKVPNYYGGLISKNSHIH